MLLISKVQAYISETRVGSSLYSIDTKENHPVRQLKCYEILALYYDKFKGVKQCRLRFGIVFMAKFCR